jgi:hypothetical protein
MNYTKLIFSNYNTLEYLDNNLINKEMLDKLVIKKAN